ncbi:helix-turn-helix domain-containing protein [Paenibacillus tarimensis]
MGNGSLFQQSLLEDHYHPRFVAYYFKQWHVFTMPFHCHDATEIMYMISGRATIEIEFAPNRTERIVLKKGEFVLLDSNVPHRLVVDAQSPCRMLNVEFTFQRQSSPLPSIKQLADEDPALLELLSVPSQYLVQRDPDEVYHTLKSLVLELDHEDTGDRPMVRLLFAQLLIRIARLRREAMSGISQDAERYVKKSIMFMQHNYDRDIQVKDIAGAVNLHPGYLQRIFRRQTGQTLMEYLTMHRMEKAKMLLLHTDIPVSDIADYVGINSRQYFHVLFKKHTQSTPISFRKTVDTHRWNLSGKDNLSPS